MRFSYVDTKKSGHFAGLEVTIEVTGPDRSLIEFGRIIRILESKLEEFGIVSKEVVDSASE